MKRALIAAVLAAVLLSGCAVGQKKTLRQHDPAGYYYNFLCFAECFVVRVWVIGGADLASTQRLVAYASERRQHFVKESEKQDYHWRYEQLRDVLWVWLDKQRDAGRLDTIKFVHFSAMLAAWR